MKCFSLQIHACKKKVHTSLFFIIQLNFTSESQSCKGVKKFGPSWAQLPSTYPPGFSQISHSEPQVFAHVCTAVSGSAHCQGPVVLPGQLLQSLWPEKVTGLGDTWAKTPWSSLGPATPGVVWTSSMCITWIPLGQNLHFNQIPRWSECVLHFWKHRPKSPYHAWLVQSRWSSGWGCFGNPGPIVTSLKKPLFPSIHEHWCENKDNQGRVL